MVHIRTDMIIRVYISLSVKSNAYVFINKVIVMVYMYYVDISEVGWGVKFINADIILV